MVREGVFRPRKIRKTRKRGEWGTVVLPVINFRRREKGEGEEWIFITETQRHKASAYYTTLSLSAFVPLC